MAGSLLALLDDIASILDDVALLTKVAAKKTAGVVGDDLALNAQQVTGVSADRELPVVLAVARGSMVNKAILVPAALAISAVAAWAVVPLLMIGGAYLCYEAFEKLAHRLLHSKAEDAAHHAELVQALADAARDPCEIEREKIKGAVRTDFILSAEIIVIALGTVAAASFGQKVLALIIVAIAMTVGVYGFVAGIVKIDDLGFYLNRRAGVAPRAIGRGLLIFAPWLMKGLSVAGTAAMFMVGGSIIIHGIPALHHAAELHGLALMLFNAVAGVIAGMLVFGVVMLVLRILKRRAGAAR